MLDCGHIVRRIQIKSISIQSYRVEEKKKSIVSV